MQQLSLISFTAALIVSSRRYINIPHVVSLMMMPFGFVCMFVRMCKALEFSEQHLVMQSNREQATNEQTRIWIMNDGISTRVK